MVLDDAIEIGAQRKPVGRILLKGDSITMIQEAQPVRPAEEEEQ
jgi:small nuclear ribonucleoprotein (snRNP)-like protein